MTGGPPHRPSRKEHHILFQEDDTPHSAGKLTLSLEAPSSKSSRRIRSSPLATTLDPQSKADGMHFVSSKDQRMIE